MSVILQQLGRHKLWLVLIGLCLLIYGLQWQLLMSFDRELIGQGQLWRIITGHLAHINLPHLGMNLLGLALLAVFFAHYQGLAYWLNALWFVALLISLGLWLDLQLDRYMGFSGLLHGLLVIAARWEYSRYRLSGVLLMTLLWLKLLWEQLFGALPGAEQLIRAAVAINAHLYGALAGMVYLLLVERIGWLSRRLLKPEQQAHNNT